MKKRKIVPVYQRDLHQDTVSYNIRFDTDKLSHGDKLVIKVEKQDEE